MPRESSERRGLAPYRRPGRLALRSRPVTAPLRQGGPMVVAHRGESATLPEHTLEAYQAAIDGGADGLECDVRLTRDGHLVCIHDRRLDRTSNGRGAVSLSTLDQLEALDFSSWHSGRPGRQPGVLRLDQLLVMALAAGRPLQLLIETKHPTRSSGWVERALLATLARHGLAQPGSPSPVTVTVMSFSALAIRRIRALAPQLRTVFLFEWALPVVRAGRAPYGADALGPRVNALRARPDVVARAHARGREVFCWTVNTASEVDLMVEYGVDWIISDRPAFVLERLGR